MASCGDLTGEYKKLQMEFLTWAANWVKNGHEPESASCDLPDVVNVLQALGFRIRNVDGQKTQPLSPLRGGENGSKVVVSCTYSGQTCFLEQPTNLANCRCIKEPKADANDAIWEITATTQQTTQELVETGCDTIPQMSKERSTVVKHVVNYLVQMIRRKDGDFSAFGHGSFSDLTNLKVTGRRSEPFHSLPRTRTPIKPQILTSRFESPTRYRSLDTLTSATDADIGLPEPGSLKPKVILESHPMTASSPVSELKLVTSLASTASTDASYTSQSSADDAPIGPKAAALMRNASDALLKALSIIEKQTEKKSSSGSINLKKLNCFKAPLSKSSLSRVPSPTFSILKPRLRVKSDSYTLEVPHEVKPRVRRISGDKSQVPEPEGVFKKKDKYAHIKSTIPKANDGANTIIKQK